jgi:hypothetical protein
LSRYHGIIQLLPKSITKLTELYLSIDGRGTLVIDATNFRVEGQKSCDKGKYCLLLVWEVSLKGEAISFGS